MTVVFFLAPTQDFRGPAESDEEPYDISESEESEEEEECMNLCNNIQTSFLDMKN